MAYIMTVGSCFLGANDVVAGPQGAHPGQVSGRVVDFDGTPLPGIGVELLGPFPDTAQRSAVADDNARFVFVDLEPGRYRVSIALPDLRAGGNADVTVAAGQRTETTLVLSLLGTAVNVIVQAEAPGISDTDLADSESTAGLRVVPGTTIRNLPLAAEQALEVLPLLPTVVRDPSGQLAIDGALPSDSVLLFNGIDLMDGYSGDYRVRLPIEAIDSVQLFTGVVPAAYGNIAGGIVDVTTLPGGESWEWGIASFFPKPRIKDGTLQGVDSASPRLRLSGPIVTGKGYASIAGEYHLDRVTVYDIPGNPTQDQQRLEGWNAFGQLDWRLSEKHSLTISSLAFPELNKFVGLDGLTPPEATINVDRNATAVLGRHTFRPNFDESLETSVQFNRIRVNSEPQGRNPFLVLTDGFGGNQFRSEDRRTSHFQSRVVYKRRFDRDEESHVVEIGADFQAFNLDGILQEDTIFVLDSAGRTRQRIDFTGPAVLNHNKYEWAGFAQDRWTHGDGFWCDLGLRYSTDSFASDHRLAPRVGVAWDPFGDRRTLVKGAVGLLYRRLFVGEIAWPQLPTRIETTFDAAGSATLRALEPRIDDDLDAPRTVQLSGDLSHRSRSGWMFRGRYSYRNTDNNVVFDRLDAPGRRIDPAVDPRRQFAPGPDVDGTLLLSSTGEARAWSVELTVAKRMGSGGQFFFSYVRSSSTGDLNEFRLLTAETVAPIIRPNRRADRPFDVPHRVVAWGTFELPREVLLTPVLEWRTGFPYSLLAEDQSYSGAPNSERFPSFFTVDLQATKSIEIKGRRFTVGAKVTNITGHDNPRQVIANVASDRFGDFRNSVPLRVRMKFAVDF